MHPDGAVALGRRIPWRLIAAAFAAVVLILAIQAVRVSRRVTSMLTPPRQSVAATQAPPGAGAVVLRPAGGPVLRGWYVPSRNGAGVILVHGYGGSRLQLLAEARALGARGYGVLLFDLRAHGESGGTRTTWGVAEQEDLAAAVDWLARRPDVGGGRIGALGFSLGAMALAEVAARDARVRAVVLAGAYTSLDAMARHDERNWGALSGGSAVWTLRRAGIDPGRVRTAAAIARIAPRPVLIVAGSSDADVPVEVTRQLHAAARMPKALLIVDGAGHGGYAASAAGDQYLHEIIAFFDRSLPLPDRTGTTALRAAACCGGAYLPRGARAGAHP